MKRVGVAVLSGVLVLLVLGGVVLALMPWWYSRPRPVPHAPPTHVADLGGDPFVSASPVQPRAAHRSGSPQPPLGATFAAGDGTREVHLSGLPFTFLTPSGWGCLKGSLKVGTADAWRCIDEHAGTGRAQVDLVIRHCAGACTDAQRAEFDTLLDHPAPYRVRDAGTRYAEQTVGGRYVLALNRVFATAPGGPADWQLLVEAEAPPGDAATVAKIVDDIWAQTL